MCSALEDLDLADDVALLSSKQQHNYTEDFSSQFGLQINAKKTHEMRIHTTSNTRLVADDIVIEQVETFTYLGSVVSTADATQKDIKSSLAKDISAFQRPRPKSKQYNRKTNIRHPYCVAVNVGVMKSDMIIFVLLVYVDSTQYDISTCQV